MRDHVRTESVITIDRNAHLSPLQDPVPGWASSHAFAHISSSEIGRSRPFMYAINSTADHPPRPAPYDHQQPRCLSMTRPQASPKRQSWPSSRGDALGKSAVAISIAQVRKRSASAVDSIVITPQKSGPVLLAPVATRMVIALYRLTDFLRNACTRHFALITYRVVHRAPRFLRGVRNSHLTSGCLRRLQRCNFYTNTGSFISPGIIGFADDMAGHRCGAAPTTYFRYLALLYSVELLDMLPLDRLRLRDHFEYRAYEERTVRGCRRGCTETVPGQDGFTFFGELAGADDRGAANGWPMPQSNSDAIPPGFRRDASAPGTCPFARRVSGRPSIGRIRARHHSSRVQLDQAASRR